MEIKVYEWLNQNIEKYICLDDAAVSKKEAFTNLFSSEHTLDEERAKETYEEFVENFYNNIIGYKNGFANKSIVAEDLDCYFINTSDGMVPIGYYRETRPVEAAMLMQKYIEICEGCMPTDKNKMVSDWQTELDSISSDFQEKKEKKHSSVGKCIASLSLGVVGFILSLVSFFMAGGFSVLSQTPNKETVEYIRNTMPCLARAGASDITTFAWWMLILAVVLLGASVFLAWELKLAKEKKLTDDLLNNSHFSVEKIEKGIQDDLENRLEEIRVAARQGKELKVEKNQNANEIDNFKKKIKISRKYVNRRHFYSHISILISLIIFVLAMPVCFTNIIPNMLDEQSYQQAITMMSNKQYEDAISKFEAIDFYKDSKDKIVECKYGQATTLLEENEPQKAKTIFKQLKDYRDSSDLVIECDYKTALNYKTDGELLKAYNEFTKLSDYKDSEEQLDKLKSPLYKKGVELYQSDDYSEAKQYFEKSVDYDREEDYLKLIDAHQGNLDNIKELYYLIDFEDTKEILLDDDNIFDFLMGSWSDAYGDHSLKYERRSATSTHCTHDLPSSSYGDYYKLEDGCHYKGSDSTSWNKQWSFEIIDVNTIEVYCYQNYSTYTLYRN